MEKSFANQDAGNPILNRVREGMSVYDRDDKKIGTVETVYFGAKTQGEGDWGTGPATVTPADQSGLRGDDVIDFAFGGILDEDSDMDSGAEVIRNRLLREGFVKVDSSGLFAEDVFVLPDQIASVAKDEVRLSAARDELIES